MADGMTITEHPPLALASLTARRGCAGRLRELVRVRWAAELPAAPRVVPGNEIRFLWAGPERWLAASPSMMGEALVASLREAAGDVASVCDQSDGSILLAVSGPHARDVLARGIPIDLHPAQFGVGDTAITLAFHVGCQIWQADDKPTYILAVPRSYGASVRAWLDEAAGGFTSG